MRSGFGGHGDIPGSGFRGPSVPTADAAIFSAIIAIAFHFREAKHV